MIRAVIRFLVVLFAAVIALCGAPALAQTNNTCNYATSQGSAPADWQTYCWLDLTGYNDATARTTGGQNFTFNFPDGSKLTFNLQVTATTAGSTALATVGVPAYSGAAFGNTAFGGITGSPLIRTSSASPGSDTTFRIRNIVVTGPGGTSVSTYNFIVADGESTAAVLTDNPVSRESLIFTTNGSSWTRLGSFNPTTGSNFPTESGAGTSTYTLTGATGDPVGGYMAGTTSPTTVDITLNTITGSQAVALALRFASIRVNKVISGARVNAADQFTYRIGNSTVPSLSSRTTSGTALSGFTAASVSLAAGQAITVSEAMAAGSTSALTAYSSSLTCVNNTVGSPTTMPTNQAVTSYTFTSLNYRDAIVCTFTNTPYPHLRLTKSLGTTPRRFDTDEFVMNISDGATVVATTTTTGTGTTVTAASTPQVKVTAGTNYTLNEAASGSTVLSAYSQAMSCTNANTSSTTPLPTAVPGTITPAMGDVIACTITNTSVSSTAALRIAKTATVVSDPINGTTNPKFLPDALINYDITVTNVGAGTVDNNTVFVVDALPPNITYNTGFAPTFTQGTPTSNLTFSTATTRLRFSNAATRPANFAACTYTPVAGFDPAVKFICFRPGGTMAAATATGTPSFTLRFQAKVN